MTVGEKIKKVRELKNYTQEFMAEKLGMSVGGYGKIERDETDIPFSRLEQIASTFNIKVEDLISFDEKVVFNIMYNTIQDNQTGINIASDLVKGEKFSENDKKLYEELLQTKNQLLEAKQTIIEYQAELLKAKK